MGYVLPACLEEKPYLRSKHFACRSPVPVLIVGPNDAWLHKYMCSIDSSYIKPVGLSSTNAIKLWPVLPLLPLVFFCCFAPTQRALLNAFPCQASQAAGLLPTFHGQAALSGIMFQCLLRMPMGTFFLYKVTDCGRKFFRGYISKKQVNIKYKAQPLCVFKIVNKKTNYKEIIINIIVSYLGSFKRRDWETNGRRRENSIESLKKKCWWMELRPKI